MYSTKMCHFYALFLLFVILGNLQAEATVGATVKDEYNCGVSDCKGLVLEYAHNFSLKSNFIGRNASKIMVSLHTCTHMLIFLFPPQRNI